jgi:cellulose synthase/poly-beta-1,6-N-acetylglucosamine synthase-like glycosyltransferase
MTAVAALVAAAVVLVAARAALGRLRAPALPPAVASPAPRVTALLPVRDEESNVEACLAAALALPELAVALVLDDGSRDRTSELARAVAARDPRVSVLAVPAPPPGWSGKTHALARGTRDVATDWILCLDADARPEPDALGRALAAAAAQRLDAVSLAARQRVGGPGEALVTPLVFGLLDLLLGDWRRAARAAGPAIANGQFVLVRRAALAASGGFAAIAGEMLDDVALARRLAAHGFRVGFWRAGGALEVRMYRGLAASFRGWRRNLALILGERRLLIAGFAAVATAPGAISAAALAAGDARAALLGWGGGALASALLRAGTGSSWPWGLLYPLDALVTSACLVAAARDRARGVLAPWRGRAVAAPQPSAPSGAA